MRILLLADEPDLRFWDHLDRSLLENLDLIISCGDLPANYLSFITCFTNAPILYVHGNHDNRYDRNPPEGCICIEDIIYKFEGLRILGLGGSMRYKPGPCMYSEKEMSKRIRKLFFPLLRSRGFDILVAHAALAGEGDSEDIPHRGFECLKKLVDKYNPPYYFHGHMHKDYNFRFQRSRTYNDTLIINAWTSHFIDIDVPKVISEREERRAKAKARKALGDA